MIEILFGNRWVMERTRFVRKDNDGSLVVTFMGGQVRRFPAGQWREAGIPSGGTIKPMVIQKTLRQNGRVR